MFAFPLGLEAKTRDFPFATVAVLAATVVYSVLNFDAVEGYEIRSLNRPTAKKLARAQAELALAACPTARLPTADCKTLSAVLTEKSADSRIAIAMAIGSQRRALQAFVFSDRWRKPSSTVRAFPEYASYTVAKNAADTDLAALAKKERVLTANNISYLSVLRSQFLHGGWAHLIGNMLFFVVFAIPVEGRFGAFGMLAIYFLGGSIGDVAQLFWQAEPNVSLVGASADIFAVAGAFMLAFWTRSLRVWTSLFFVVSQTVRMPTWAFFAFFILLGEVSGALDGGGKVAHFAHLGAFVPGFVMAAAALFFSRLEPACVFPFEQKLLNRARSAPALPDKLAVLGEILIFNPGNEAALSAGWAAISPAFLTPWEQAPKQVRAFLHRHGGELLLWRATLGANTLASTVTAILASGWSGEVFVDLRKVAVLQAKAAELCRNRPTFDKGLAIIDWICLALRNSKSLQDAARLSAIQSLRAELIAQEAAGDAIGAA